MAQQLEPYHHIEDKLFPSTMRHNRRIVGAVGEAFESLSVGIRSSTCFFNHRNYGCNRSSPGIFRSLEIRCTEFDSVFWSPVIVAVHFNFFFWRRDLLCRNKRISDGFYTVTGFDFQCQNPSDFDIWRNDVLDCEFNEGLDPVSFKTCINN